MRYKTIAKDKFTNEMVSICRDYPTKKAFIEDLRRNGYAVDEKMVKTEAGFDYVMDNTNCNWWDWKAVK